MRVMKVAIPVFNERVSPRFDNAQMFILFVAESESVVDREELCTQKWTLNKKITTLVDRDIETIICGGIDRWSMRQFKRYGVRIYSWVTGSVDDALSCFLKGQLASGYILEKGGRVREQWRFRGKKDLLFGCNPLKENIQEEVSDMPGKKGTGSQGQGRGTGRGRGGRGAGADQGTGCSRDSGKGGVGKGGGGQGRGGQDGCGQKGGGGRG